MTEVGNDLLRKLAFTLGFQQKSFCLTRDESNHFEMFGYEYIGEGSLVKDLEVYGQLCRNLKISSKILLDPTDWSLKRTT